MSRRGFLSASLVFMAASASTVSALAGEPSPHEALPVRYVDRGLTLPALTLSPSFDVGVTHSEIGSFTLNQVPVDLGASLGVVDDLQVDLVPATLQIVRADVGGASDTKVFYGTFKLGATYRFFDSDVVELGGRFEFGATGLDDTVHMTASVPVRIHAGNVVRIDTGLALSMIIPTKGGSVDGGLVGAGHPSPLYALMGPGIPFDVTFQLGDHAFVGLDLGFGLASFSGEANPDGSTSVDRSAFGSLGAHLGGTISDGAERPVADIAGVFDFPAFVFAEDRPPLQQVWYAGLDTRLYFQL
jgi:hypothetical protein